MQLLISNLKHQSILSIILAALGGYTATYIWYYIPFVAHTTFGDMPQNAEQAPFLVTLWYLINSLINTIGLAMFIEKKDTASGFAVGAVVAIIFGGTAFLTYYFGAGQFPPIMLTLISMVGNLLFYAVPATLLAHLRKS